MGFVRVLCYFGEGFSELSWGLDAVRNCGNCDDASDWLLSRRTEDKSKTKAIGDKEAAVTHISQMGPCAHFVFGTMFINLSVFSGLGLSWSILVARWPFLICMFWEVVYGQHSIKMQLEATSWLSRAAFPFLSGHLGCFHFFCKMDILLCMFFIVLGVYLQGKFLKFGFLGQKIHI